MRSTKLLSIVVSLVLGLVLIGCSQQAEPTTAPSGGDEGEVAQSESDDGAQDAPEELRTVVFIPKATESTFWLALLQGARDAAEELGGYNEVEYQGVADQRDISGQVSVVENMVSRQVNGILLAATDATALSPAVEQAVENGIPVITVDSGVESDAPLAYIETDNLAAAEVAADTLAELINEQGVVGDIGITAGSVTGQQREDGFRDRMNEAYPDIEVLEVQYSACDPSTALDIANDMLTGKPDLNGFYGACDGAGVGAGQAVNQRGLGDQVRIVSFDVTPEEFQLFLDGYIDALIVQDPWSMGYEGMMQLHQVINGGEVDTEHKQIPAVVVTQDNLDDPEIQRLLSTYPDIAEILEGRE